MSEPSSQIFAPFRVLGLIAGDVPFVLQRRGTENFVTLACEKSFQVLNVRSHFFISSIPFYSSFHPPPLVGLNSAPSCTCSL